MTWKSTWKFRGVDIIISNGVRLKTTRVEEILEKLNQSSPDKIFKLNPDDNETIEYFKLIIDCELDKANGFELEFSDDYTRIKKSTPWKY